MNLQTEKMLKDMRPPDQIADLDYVLERLEVRDKHPVLYNRFKDIHAARQREEQREADAREVWVRAGGEERDFAAHWKEISAQRKVEAIKSADAQAEAEAWSSTRAGF